MSKASASSFVSFFFRLGLGAGVSVSSSRGCGLIRTRVNALALPHAQIVGVTRHSTIMCAAHMATMIHRRTIIMNAHGGVSLPASRATSILSIASLTRLVEFNIGAQSLDRGRVPQLARVGARIPLTLINKSKYTRATHSKVRQVVMPPAKKTTKKPRAAPTATVEAGGMLDTCNELAGFMADGVMAFVKDKECSGDTRRDCPPAYKGKGGMLAASRLINKEIRTELDSRIK
eukprot:7382553-Prymnesium_polylepis.2